MLLESVHMLYTILYYSWRPSRLPVCYYTASKYYEIQLTLSFRTGTLIATTASFGVFVIVVQFIVDGYTNVGVVV